MDSKYVEYPDECPDQVKFVIAQLNDYFKDEDPEFQISSCQDLVSKMSDGCVMLQLLKSKFCLSISHKLPSFIHSLDLIVENWNFALNILRENNVPFIEVSPQDLASGNFNSIVEVLNSFFLHIQRDIIVVYSSGARIQLTKWIREIMPPFVHEQWPFLRILNYTSDWFDGYLLAHLFNALCQKRANFLEKVINPKLLPRGILFQENSQASRDLLKPCIVIENRKLGVELIEEVMTKSQDFLGIPKLFEAKEIIECPCDLSMMTYVSYFRDREDELKINPKAQPKCFTYYNSKYILLHIESRIKEYCIHVLFLLSNSLDFRSLPQELIYFLMTQLIHSITYLLFLFSFCPLCDRDEMSCAWESMILSHLKKNLECR